MSDRKAILLKECHARSKSDPIRCSKVSSFDLIQCYDRTEIDKYTLKIAARTSHISLHLKNVFSVFETSKTFFGYIAYKLFLRIVGGLFSCQKCQILFEIVILAAHVR